MNITTFSDYQLSVAKELEKELQKLRKPLSELSFEEIKANNQQLLSLPGIEDKELDIEPLIFDRSTIDSQRAVRAILDGDIFWEHTAAGEATRLGLGTKYLLNNDVLRSAFQKHPNFIEEFDDQQAAIRKTMTLRERKEALALLQDVSPINMGIRHLVQQIIDIKTLAQENNYDEAMALHNQSNLIIMNEMTADQIIAELQGLNFLGLDQEKTFFMVQRSAHGFKLDNGNILIDESSERRLYNHGGMRLQTAMENEIFFFRAANPVYISSSEYEEILSAKKIMLSINIEDLDWLEKSIDIATCALGLELADKGTEMVMTAVQQKEPPQKGGFFCQLQGKTVCVETDSDPEMFDADVEVLRKIKYLNKNMNYYPNPAMMIRKMKQEDLPIHPTVKGSALYPQTPQGDLNFILKTEVIQEKQPKAIRNLKTQKDILETLKQFKKQDELEAVGAYLSALKN